MDNKLKQLRLEHGYSTRSLAEALTEFGFKTTSITISRYERGEREPKLAIWQKLADFFDVPVGYIQGVTDIKQHFIYEDYDFNKAAANSKTAHDAIFNDFGSVLDDKKQYEHDNATGRNDVLLNQYNQLIKMFYYGGELTNGGLPNKKTRINLVKALDNIFSNAHQIYEDAENYDIDNIDVDSYGTFEVNKYIESLLKYDPYWWDHTDLTAYLKDKNDLYYKKEKLNSEQKNELVKFLDNLKK